MSFEKMMVAFESGGLKPRTGYETYYEGRGRVSALGVSLPPKARILEVQAPWAKMSTDVLTEVLIPAGFISGTEEDQDAVEYLEKVWQHNDMDSQFNLAASESIAVGAAYWVMSPPDDDSEYPYIRALDSKHARVRLDAWGNTVEGLAVYRLDPETLGATYYTPDGVQFYAKSSAEAGWATAGGAASGWRVGAGRLDAWGPSIVPMFNRARLADKYGRSDIAELAPIIDAASRTLTNLQVAQEVAAWPMRMLVGDASAQILDAQPDMMQSYIGSLFAAPAGSDLKQLTGADLTPIQTIYKTYALQISAMTGIPPSMMGVSADSNPTSAEALRVAKDRLIARAESKQRQFADSLEAIARAVCIMGGYDLEEPTGLEVQWRDAASPSTSAMMQSALQAQAQGVLSSETTRDFMFLSPQQRAREDARSEEIDEMAGHGIADMRLDEEPADEENEETPAEDDAPTPVEEAEAPEKRKRRR